MNAETQIFKLLQSDAKLNSLFDKIRGAPYGNGFEQGIFKYGIPEKPTNLKKSELAPFLRINPVYDNPFDYADDDEIASEQRIVINFWCRTSEQSDKIAKRIDDILKENNFERYTSNEKPRFLDPDIDLLINVRKYRIFSYN